MQARVNPGYHQFTPCGATSRSGDEFCGIHPLLISPKGRVPRAMPVGECKGGDMVNFSHGKSFFWSWSISDGISYSMDTEISPPNPEFWNAWIFEKTFPKGNEGDAGLREGRVEYAG